MVKETPPHHTIKRRSDDPKLQIREKVSVKEGVIGMVLARYTPSGAPNEVRYVVEIISDLGEADAMTTANWWTRHTPSQ